MNAMLKPVEVEDSGPIDGRGLTPMRAEYVKNLIQGMKPAKAAELAGYSCPAQQAVYLNKQPIIQDAIRRKSEEVLITEGLANALKFMVTAPMNEKLPGAVRFQASKWVMEAAGQGLAAQRAALGLPPEDKPLSEMSTAELDGLIGAMRTRLLETRAQVIEGEARNVTSERVAGATQVIEHKGDHDK